ncbi:hypothetical protein MMC11_007635, partial [Xylographa trunciseda]|nr:hypothetical protein [Xylographa trunciseda]
SEEDWDRESAIMGDIYANGVCNLAACTGSDGTTGLFPANDTWFSHTCVVKPGPASCLDGLFSVRNTEIVCDSAEAHVRDKIITSRGWCVQELTLSKRVLYFAKHQVVWDCRSFIAREQDPTCLLDTKDFNFRSSKHDVHPDIMKYIETCHERGVDPDIFTLYRNWMGTVRRFTLCNLTRQNDKLVAISGLARKFHEALGPNEEYVGGIWKRYSHLHLLWDGSYRTNFRWREYRAPSWSWASFEGCVYNHRTSDEAVSNCTSLIRASTEQKLASANPYGTLSSAILHIEGPLLKMCLGRVSQHMVTTFVTKCGLQFSVTQGFLIVLDFNVGGIDSIDVYCLLVVQEAHSEEKTQLAGLVLVRQGSVKGQYIRIGLGFVLPTELLQEARSQRLADENDYEFILENKDYKISVI